MTYTFSLNPDDFSYSIDEPNAGRKASETLSALVDAKLQEHKHFTYSQAFKAVQKENPELVATYVEELRGL